MNKRCPECFVAEGELHVPGCLQEECSICGEQSTECGHEGAWRLPYLHFPRICARCGKMNPAIFIVPDNEWQKYVPPSVRGQHLCRKCYNEIKEIQDANV